MKPWITAVVAAGLVLSCAQPKDSPEEVIARLVAAAGEYRPFMPRISGGFNHSKCDVGAAELELSSVMCGTPLPTGFDDVAQLVSASTGKHGPSLDVDRMRAIWRLQWVSVAGNLDGAIDLLSGIVTAGEADPRVHNDLAAAFLVRSSVENDPADLFRALGAVTRALAVDSLFPEALYNRAMTLQLLGFRVRASEAWRSYVEVEPNREWRNEGVRILERLESENFLIPFDSVRALALDTNIPPSDVVPYMSPHLASFRQLLFSKFIPSWAMHLSSGDSAAAFGEWENSVRLANLLEEASHDEFPRAVMVALELSGREADLVAAIDLLREGIESFDAFRYTEAGPKLEAAREMLGALHQPLALWAQLQSAISWYQQAEYDTAIALATEIVDGTAGRNFHSVHARSLGLRALIHGIVGRLSLSVADDQAQIVPLEAMNDKMLLARAYTGLAHARSELGLESAAWAARFEALKLFDASLNTIARYSILSSASSGATSIGEKVAGEFFSEESVELTRSGSLSFLRSSVLARYAESLADMGRLSEARAMVDSALAIADSVESEEVRRIKRADVMLVRGEIGALVGDTTVLSDLDQVEEVFVSTDYGLKLARLRVARANLFVLVGDTLSAVREFEEAVEEIDRQRGFTVTPAERRSFLDKARPVFNALVDFEVGVGNVKEAFDFSEMVRGRVMLESLGESAEVFDPITADSLQKLIPAGTAVVSYTVLEDEILIWFVDSMRVTVKRVDVNEAALERLVERANESFVENLPERDSLSAELYEYLILPIRSLLPRGGRVVFVPDRWLHYVPFAGLKDGIDGSFLVEDFAVSFAPSGTVWGIGSARAVESGLRGSSGGFLSVLAVGDPAFDRESYPLSRLPASASEAQAVAQLYGNSLVLVGAEASRGRFLRELPRRQVVHFAGHAMSNATDPSGSFLLLAKGSGLLGETVEGEVDSETLSGLELSGVRLVVLSACYTDGGAISETEGPLSLARAFLTAGVSGVVATLWEVEDRAAADFSIRFHGLLADGLEPIDALREVQLLMLNEGAAASGGPGSHGQSWMGFQFIGN